MDLARRGVLGRGLFTLGCCLGGLLVALVLLSPVVDAGDDFPAEGWSRVIQLFARDAALRRTALASAAGLVVSACVFFRPDHRAPRSVETAAPPRRPSSGGMAGA
jgi:hypothetical protein